MHRKASRRLLAVGLLLVLPLVAGCLDDPPQTGAACPADLQAEPGPAGEIHLSWEPVSDAQSYPVLRADPGAEATLVANVSAGTTSLTDQSAQPGETYRYTVHSWNGTAISTDCPATEVTTIPFFPSLAATVAIGGLVALGALGALGLQRRG